MIDNASEDASRAVARRSWPGLELIGNDANLGFAEACNQGIAATRAEWVCTLNPDTEVAPGWLGALRGALRGADERLGMLQSRMEFAGNGRLNSTGIRLTRWGRAGDRHFGAPASHAPGPGPVFCPTAGAACYRRTMLEAVRLDSGIFDRTLFAYWEDVDLGWRCRLAGWEALYLPEARVRHHYQASVRQRRPGFAERRIRRNRLASLCKNASMGFLLRTLPATFMDLAGMVRADGMGELALAGRAARDGWRQRAAVGRLARLPRRRVERDWAGVD